MKPSRAIEWLSMLLPVCASADSSRLSDFRIEVELANPGEAQVSVPVRCLEGCDWEVMIIECVAGESVCRATITARVHAEASPSMGARPIGGTVCLGAGATSLEAATSLGLRAESPAGKEQGSVVVGMIMEGSPAMLAGFEVGDLVITFNGVPVLEPREVKEAILGMAPGQQFEATVDRNGELVRVRGALGMYTTANTCVPADAQWLRMPAVTPEEVEPVPFELAIDTDRAIEAECLQGCGWTRAGLSDFAGPDASLRRSIVIDRYDLRPGVDQ